MENGIRILEAVDDSGKLHSLMSLHMDHEAGMVMPSLYCPDSRCHCAVRLVPRGLHGIYRTLRLGAPISYIGLASGASHTAECCYNTQQQLAQLLRSASPELIYHQQQPPSELALLPLRNGLSKKTISRIRPRNAAAVDSRQDSLPNEEVLTANLQTMGELLIFRARCDGDRYLAERLILRFGAQRIAWNAFYFERRRYGDAWLSVKRGRSTMYPIALQGEVTALTPSRSSVMREHNSFSCVPTCYREKHSGHDETYEATVFYDDAALSRNLTVGSQVVMFGLWEFREAVKANPDGADEVRAMRASNRKLLLHVRHQHQILVLPQVQARLPETQLAQRYASPTFRLRNQPFNYRILSG